MSVSASEAQHQLVRMAGRALGRHQLAHAYGHCSLRLNADFMLVCAPEPMGLLSPDSQGTVVSINAPLPGGVLGEVRLHQVIYRTRPEIKGICRTMPPSVMALSALQRVPKPRHGMGTYFWPEPAFWPDVQLIRDDQNATLAVQRMADSPALIMQGNGVVMCADDLRKACVLTWFLEDAARIELQALHCGLADQAAITEQAAAARATWNGGIMERMWAYLTAEDVEGQTRLAGNE
ncbi:MAG: class II aldolase/adducin family protein [Natronospirillum sp.]